MVTSQELWDEAEAAFEAQIEHALALEHLIASHAVELTEWKKANRAIEVAIRRAERARKRAEHVGRVLTKASKLVARDRDSVA